MFRNKKLRNSLFFKLFLSVCIIILPLIIIHIVSNYYSLKVIRNQVVQSNKNMLNLHMNQIDSNLHGVRNFLFQLSQDDDLTFYQSDENIDENSYLKAKLRLHNTISNHSNFYTTIDSIFIYSIPNDDMIYTGFGSNYLEKLGVIEEINNKLKFDSDNLVNNHWNLWQADDKYYLFYITKNEDYYIGAWMNMEKLVTPFKFIDLGESGRTIVSTSDHLPITEKEFIEENGILLNESEKVNEEYSISGDKEQYIVIKEGSSVADFKLNALIPERTMLENLPLLQRISWVITFIAIAFILILIFLMSKNFLSPILKIVGAMRKLEKGDLEVRLPRKGNSTEIEVMNDSFNRMVSEIEELKINDYERKINLQNAELKHLQLQINPHFFLNSLNIIYNLAMVKEYGLIQEMSKSLADYFRFMFKSNSYYVDFEEELFHTKNYLKIQELRFPDGFTYYMDVDDHVMEYKIPPLIIQSLVENSIKHAFKIGEPIEIFVIVWLAGHSDDDSVYIQIEDTGDGFPKQILQSLQRNEELINEDGSRIGIWNVKRRLELLYGKDKVGINFDNGEHGGAVIRLRIPLRKHI